MTGCRDYSRCRIDPYFIVFTTASMSGRKKVSLYVPGQEEISVSMSARKVFLPLEKLDKCSVCGRMDLKLRWCMSCAEVCGEPSHDSLSSVFGRSFIARMNAKQRTGNRTRLNVVRLIWRILFLKGLLNHLYIPRYHRSNRFTSVLSSTRVHCPDLPHASRCTSSWS